MWFVLLGGCLFQACLTAAFLGLASTSDWAYSVLERPRLAPLRSWLPLQLPPLGVDPVVVVVVQLGSDPAVPGLLEAVPHPTPDHVLHVIPAPLS